jgi:ribosomal protein S6
LDKKQLYEAMYLADAAKGGEELPSFIEHVVGLLERHGAEIERIEKWDERELAYKIKGVTRGLYILVYFRSDPAAIQDITHSINMSEEILRVQILKAEEMVPLTGEELTKDGEVIVAEEEPEVEETAETEGVTD